MIITEARFSEGELHLRCEPTDGVRFCYNFKEGGDYDIVPAKKRKTLNANNYAWALIDQIASKLRMDPIEVYRQAIRETPGITAAVVCIKDIAAPDLIRSWEEGHLGRQAMQYPSNFPGFVDVTLVYGSSDYDREQMSRLIDNLVQDAQDLGIETKDPGYIESLLSRWKA